MHQTLAFKKTSPHLPELNIGKSMHGQKTQVSTPWLVLQQLITLFQYNLFARGQIFEDNSFKGQRILTTGAKDALC